MLITPQKQNQILKDRIAKALANLPAMWINTFVHVYPEYSNMKNHLHNVARSKSMDENVIEKMEQLAETLKPKQ